MHCSSDEEHQQQVKFQHHQHLYKQEQQHHYQQRFERQQLAGSPVTSSSQASIAADCATAADSAASIRVASAYYQAEQMDADCRELLRRHFEEKINRKSKYELVAAFTIVEGEILAYTAYRERLQQPFQLTERRRRLVRTYYRCGERNVLLYVNSAGSEHYMPLAYVIHDCSHQRRLRRRFQEASAALALTTESGSAGLGTTLMRLMSG